MRILMVHNYYQRWGGEDESTEHELRLLKERGHKVWLYSRHNDEIKMLSLFRKGFLFFEPTWSWKSYREMKQVIQEFKPEVIHFQNFFPLVSPSAHYARAESDVPIIQTLRNYRLLCPIGSFFRNGEVCEECLVHSLWRGIRYGCYHDSRIQTASIALMLKAHRLLNTWQKRVDTFITLTEFSRHKFIKGGLPALKLFIRPNFLDRDPGIGDQLRDYALFVGRLSEEKGLTTLLEAWRGLPEVPLKIIGDGPLRPQLERFARQHTLTQVELVGFVPRDVVLDYLKRASFLVMPSVWYETFGRTIIEAYATGTPVLASRLGAMAEIVEDGCTGLLFTPGDPVDLAAKVEWAWAHPNQMWKMGWEARREYEAKYTAEKNYDALIEVYRHAIEKAQ
jgi:glycosyltransferase involved in cell wall biosynthesis